MRSYRRPLSCWLLALACAGCSAGVAPIEVAAGCPEQPARGSAQLAAAAEQDLIDDFEHEGALLPRRGGRNGTWALASDGTADEVEASTSDRCAARGQRAGHFYGSGFSSWANWTALLRSAAGTTSTAYDATAYGGISFWAAVGAQTPAPFSVQVGVTTPPASGVSCPRCMNYYASEVSLEHNWRRIELRFSDLVQVNVGNPLVPLQLSELVGLTFWPTEDFDIWLDDVRFEP